MKPFEQLLRLRQVAAGSELRAQLESMLQSQSDAAAQKLMSGAPADDELPRIDQIQTLIKSVSPGKPAPPTLACAVAATCPVAACVLWTIRLPTRVQMTVTTESVTVG